MTSTEILNAIADKSGLDVETIKGRHRDNVRSQVRQLAVLLCHEKTRLTLTGLGRVFGRGHTTMLYSIKQGRELVASQEWARDLYAAVKEM